MLRECVEAIDTDLVFFQLRGRVTGRLRGGGSNSRPSHCERDALPAELPPHDQTILARRKITVPDQRPGSLRRSRRPSQHPIHDCPNISIIHRRMRRHGNRAPDAGTTILHFPRKQSPSPSIPLVLLRHLLKRRPDKLPINRMASHTSISPSDGRPTRRRIGSMRGVKKTSHNQTTHHRPKTSTPKTQPHCPAFGFPGRTCVELLTGAGACCSNGFEVTDESGTAPEVTSASG